MKKLIMICLMLFSLNLTGQNDSIPTENQYKYYDSFNDYWSTVTFKIGGGVFMPLGKLENYFSASPLFELSLDFPVTDKKSIELALQFVLPEQRKFFQYIDNIEDYQSEASLLFNPMVRFKKNLSRSESSKFILGLGIGAAVISSTKKTNSSGDDEKYEITSFLVSPNIDYVKTFKNKEQLTFSFGINYSPYKIKGAMQEDIGSIALTPRLLYSF